MRLVLGWILIPWLAGSLSAEQIMSREKVQAYRAMLPQLLDEEWNEHLHDHRVLWFDAASMPPAAQHVLGNGYSETTAFNPFRNISGDPSDANLPRYGLRAGGGGIEFPWAVAPGGGHNSPGVNSYKGQLLLDMENWPVLVFQDELPGRVGTVTNTGQYIRPMLIRGGVPKPFFHATGQQKYRNGVIAWRWTHPPNKYMDIEVITQKIGGYDVPFEVRFRIREDEEWGVQIFRPVLNAKDFADKLQDLSESPLRRNAISYLRVKNRPLPSMRLHASLHVDKESFDVTSEIYYIPEIDSAALDAILSLPFENVTGENFYGEAAAPSNNTGKPNIVPPNWQGVFAGNDRHSCMNCHQHTNRSVTEFQNNRGWYMRTRGSGGSFAAHYFDPSCIGDGVHKPIRFRQAFIDSGRIRILQPDSDGMTRIPAGYKILKEFY